MSSYLTSSTLIAEVKRSGSVPTSQSLFQNSDFLAFANQEMKIGLVPSILQHHQEYYVRDSAPVKIQPNQTNYPIPYRALGGRLREVYYLDDNNNLRAMTRISPDDRPFWQQGNFQYTFVPFFIQGDEIVLLTDGLQQNITGSLVFSFFMRPNELVDESQVATIESISTTNKTGAITAISTGNPSILTSISHGLISGNIITISQSDSNPLINGSYTITVIDSDHFSIPANISIAGTTAAWTFQTTTYIVDQMPSGFGVSTLYDLMQTNPGHKTINFDVLPLFIDNINKIMIFNTVNTLPATIAPNVGTGPIVGDYIAFAGQCIIPQAPTELHDLLAQRTLGRCLQAMGDQANYQVVVQRIQEMEKNLGILVDNRTEGSPQKINNIRGLLRTSKITRRGWL